MHWRGTWCGHFSNCYPMKIRVPFAPRHIVAVLAAAASVPASFAQSSTLRETVVTSSRTQTRIDEQLADVTVITRADIERSGSSSLVEILATVPGVQATPDSIRGGNASVFIRGANHSHTLVLVDGQRISSATTGATALQHVPLDQIERIEILRGPASSLYGSDAIGGVIQVFTRQGRGAPAPTGSVTVGTYGTVNASAGYGGEVDGTRFHLQVGVDRTKGFSDIAGPKDGGNYDSFNPDRDGYHQRNLGLNVSRRVSPSLELAANVLVTDTAKRSDGLNCGPSYTCTADFDNRDRQRLQNLGVRATYQASPGWKSTVWAGESLDSLRSWLLDPDTQVVKVERYQTRQRQVGWQNEVRLGAGLLMATLERRSLHADTTQDLIVSDQDTTAAIVGYQAWFGPHLVQASVRRDRIERLGSNDSGTAGYGYKFAPGWVARASAGTGFHAPSFNDLYWPVDAANMYQGNPDLRPERSRNVEVGLNFTQGATRASATLYRNRVRDLIEYQFNDLTYMGSMANVSNATLEGLSLQASTVWKDWTLAANYDVQSPRNDATGNVLARRVPRIATVDVERRFGPFDIGARLQGFSRRFNDPDNLQPLGGYGLLSLRGTYRLDRQWSVHATVQNALDKNYVIAQGSFAPYNQYATAGRSYYVTLRFSGL